MSSLNKYSFNYGSDSTLNFAKTAIDPFIIAALDVRFWHAWKKACQSTRNTVLATTTNHGRVQPSTTNPAMFSIRTPRLPSSRV